MAAKNSIKIYSENSYYHIYNRGVEKRQIFKDKQDYAVFISYLKNYLMPKNEDELRKQLCDPNLNYREKERILRELRLNNFYEEIILISYCLMKNHFHFLVKQKSANSIDKFMNSLGIRYTMYFNRKYKRVGPLYQDVYKAVLVESEPQLLYLTSYIHRNPLGTKDDVLRGWFNQPSSYPEYLNLRKTEWIHPGDILGYFSKNNPKLSYKKFVEQEEDLSLIKNIAIDDH